MKLPDRLVAYTVTIILISLFGPVKLWWSDIWRLKILRLSITLSIYYMMKFIFSQKFSFGDWGQFFKARTWRLLGWTVVVNHGKSAKKDIEAMELSFVWIWTSAPQECTSAILSTRVRTPWENFNIQFFSKKYAFIFFWAIFWLDYWIFFKKY